MRRIWRSLLFRLNGFIRPRMVYGYKRHDGVWLPRTRVSNMTQIGTPERLDIKDNVWICHFSFLDASAGLVIEEGCQIGSYVTLATHSSHISIRLYGDEYLAHKEHIGYIKASSRIGAYTFVGPYSLIMPGVSIGKGSIVSAYSHVIAGDYPDFAWIAGNPAKVIGDTRRMDNRLLNKHPELRAHYDAWAND